MGLVSFTRTKHYLHRKIIAENGGCSIAANTKPDGTKNVELVHNAVREHGIAALINLGCDENRHQDTKNN